MKRLRNVVLGLLKVHDFLCIGCARLADWMMLAMALIISYEVGL